MAGVDTEIDGEARPMPGPQGRLPASGAATWTRRRPSVTSLKRRVGRDQVRLRPVWTRSMPPTPSLMPTSMPWLPSRRQAGSHPAKRRRSQPGASAGCRLPMPCALPGLGRQDRAPLRWREAPRGAVPPAAVGSGHAAAGRTDQPPGRRLGGLAGTLPPSTSPAPWWLITHDRYFLDNVAGWILELDRGHGIPTRATTPAGWTPRPSPSGCRKPSRSRSTPRP